MIFKMLHNILHCKFNISNIQILNVVFPYLLYSVFKQISDSVLYVVNVKFNVLTVQKSGFRCRVKACKVY